MTPKPIVGAFIDNELATPNPPQNRPKGALELTPSDQPTLQKALQSCQRAVAIWSAYTPQARAAVIANAALLMREQLHDFAHVCSSETGKNWGQCLMDDVPNSAAILSLCAQNICCAQTLSCQQDGGWHLRQRMARGVVAYCIPQHLPLLAMSAQLAGALAAGNCLLLCADIGSIHQTLAMARLFHRAGLPAGVVNVVIANHHNLHKAAPEIAIWSTQAGNSVALVAEDGALKTAVAELLYANFANGHYQAANPANLLIHQNIFDLFVQKFCAGAQKNPDFAPFASDSQRLNNALFFKRQSQTAAYIAQLNTSGATEIAMPWAQAADFLPRFFIAPQPIAVPAGVAVVTFTRYQHASALPTLAPPADFQNLWLCAPRWQDVAQYPYQNIFIAPFASTANAAQAQQLVAQYSQMQNIIIGSQPQPHAFSAVD